MTVNAGRHSRRLFLSRLYAMSLHVASGTSSDKITVILPLEFSCFVSSCVSFMVYCGCWSPTKAASVIRLFQYSVPHSAPLGRTQVFSVFCSPLFEFFFLLHLK